MGGFYRETRKQPEPTAPQNPARRTEDCGCSTQQRQCATIQPVKAYIHARLGAKERATLEELKQATGRTESELVRRGLQLVAQEAGRRQSALDLAARSVGRFKRGP